MHVVATAGHVDHGKSTLVRALTGQEPDRLAEERRRGLSIELGYAWTELGDLGEVAFVDVPGHERFLTTALAGVGPVPVAMLVVAADDAWMPQAAEHLAALDALGITDGLLVVTRADLADPAPALERARAQLAGTSLAGAPDVVVSGRTGAGIDRLRATLAGVLREVRTPDPGADARLWVDRRFHVRGAGTVVTGTLLAGTVTTGSVLEADGHVVRVRGIEALQREREQISAPARVALNLGGHVHDAVQRGVALVAPGAFHATTVVDLATAGAAQLPRSPILHVGSAAVAVHARPLGEDHVRLVLERPLPLRIGDRTVLRDPGTRRLWGARVVDPLPPELLRRGAARRRAERLAAHDGSLASELDIRRVVRRADLRRIGVDVSTLPTGTVSAGDWLLGPAHAEEARTALRRLVDEREPLAEPLTTQAAARALDLPHHSLVSALVVTPLREVEGVVVEERGAPPGELQAALDEVRRDLADDPFAAPDRLRLRELGLDVRALAILERLGSVLRVGGDVVLLPDAGERALERLMVLPQPFTASEARSALGTSRRVVLPLLEYLDRVGHTRRLPDDRREVRGRGSSGIASAT